MEDAVIEPATVAGPIEPAAPLELQYTGETAGRVCLIQVEQKVKVKLFGGKEALAELRPISKPPSIWEKLEIREQRAYGRLDAA